MKYLVATLLFAVVFAKNEIYTGFKSYIVGPVNQDDLETVVAILAKYNVDPLSRPGIKRAGLVLVGDEGHDAFIEELEKNYIEYKLHSGDVKAALDKEDEISEIRRKNPMTRRYGTFYYDDYQPYFMVEKYMMDVVRNYPTVAKLVTPAKSFEGRTMSYIKISTTNFEDTSKPVIFIDGTIHAREWIAVPVMTYAIHKLVENVTDSDLLDKYDWIILPVVNPDGYDYSYNRARFWRKTMSTDYENSERCPGVDGNRNYDFFWGTVGTSRNPCDDIYGGHEAFSEIETQVVRDIIDEYLPRLKFYLTMHSFGSCILYPYGHNGQSSEHKDSLEEVGVAMANAIDEVALPNFPKYEVGNAVHLLGYGASGGSEDYAHYVGVQFAYTYELPGLFDGFNLNPIYIEQVAYETWLGIAAGARKIDEISSRK